MAQVEGLLDQLQFAESAITKGLEHVNPESDDTFDLAAEFANMTFQSAWQLRENSFPYIHDIYFPSLSSSAESIYTSSTHSSMPELMSDVEDGYNGDSEVCPDSV